MNIENIDYKNPDYEKLFRSRWKWISKNPFSEKDEWPDHYILEYNSCNIPCIVNDLIKKGKDDGICEHCPVKWVNRKEEKDSFCLQEGSKYLYYHKIQYSSDNKNPYNKNLLEYIANAISELPWKE